MKSASKNITLIAIVFLLFPQLLWAMGLRSFVALPIEEGGHVIRLIAEQNKRPSNTYLSANYAYGISAKQTLLLSLPYRLSPSGSERTGNISALYRHIIWQNDSPNSTTRIGLLGGAVLATKKERDSSIQAGIVSSFYQQRYEFDADILYRQGLGNNKNTGRYDFSWQYRLSPAHYPEWGSTSEWDGVIELNGRYLEGNSTTHQITTGLQWIHKQWVLEGGIFHDLNNKHNTGLLLSTRLHF